MEKFTKRQIVIIESLQLADRSTAELLDLLSQQAFRLSEDSVARDIAGLRDIHGLAESYGAGPARKHRITSRGRLLAPLTYERFATYLAGSRQPIGFNHDWLVKLVSQDLFEAYELEELRQLQRTFQDFMNRASDAIKNRWYQKWLIEFAWKSSMIEGNTYDELETETLLLEHIEARGKTHAEAVMIMNHQIAIQYVYDHSNRFNTINLSLLEDVHERVIEGLNVGKGIRTMGVGISGSVYRPLATKEALENEVELLMRQINAVENVWTRCVAVLLALSYLQLFEDGNKRTARIMANGLLYANGAIPLVLGTSDPTRYRRACIAFYELGNVYLMKNLLLDSWRETVQNLQV